MVSDGQNAGNLAKSDTRADTKPQHSSPSSYAAVSSLNSYECSFKHLSLDRNTQKPRRTTARVCILAQGRVLVRRHDLTAKREANKRRSWRRYHYLAFGIYWTDVLGLFWRIIVAGLCRYTHFSLPMACANSRRIHSYSRYLFVCDF